jgi:hypothetical protein
MPEILLLLCQAGLALTFALAATHKAADLGAFRRSIPLTLPIAASHAGAVARLTIGAEGAVALALMLGLADSLLRTVGFTLAGALLVVLTGAVVVMIRRGAAEPCHCFGFSARPPGATDVIRNLFLLAVAGAGGVLSSLDGPGGSAVGYPQMVLIFLAVLGVFNAAIAVALLRRVTQQSALLKASIEGVANPAPIMMTAGQRVGSFDATTVAGQPVSREGLRGNTLVGFLSPTCPACAESLPGFILRAMEAGQEQTLVVIAGQTVAAQPLLDKLTPVARVVVEPDHGPLARAFKVDGFPAFAMLDGDTVLASHFALDRIPEATPA